MKMNKTFIVIICIVLFAGSLIAGGTVANLNKNLTFEKAKADALILKGISSYDVKDYKLGTEAVERCLFKENAINSCQTFQTYYMNCTSYDEDKNCNGYSKVYYTEDKLLEMKNTWEHQRLSGIADAIIARGDNTKSAKDKVGEGVTTVK